MLDGLVTSNMPSRDGNTNLLQNMLDVAATEDDGDYGQVIASASERLLKLTRKMLRSYPHVRRWEQTDDVFQGAVMRLYRSLHEVKPQNERMFFGLATTQIRRTLIDLARHYYGPLGIGAKHHSDGNLGVSRATLQNHPDGASRPETLEEWAGFHEAVEAISAPEREVFQLVWYGGLEQKEVASLLDVSVPTVKRRLHRARRSLSRALQDNLPSTEEQ